MNLPNQCQQLSRVLLVLDEDLTECLYTMMGLDVDKKQLTCDICGIYDD